jgi:hypothetical protein
MERPDDPFVLQQPEFYALQRYIDGARRLPATPKELETLTGIPEQKAIEFNDLLRVYGSIKECCAHFFKDVLPLNITLATDVITYARSTAISYRALYTLAQDYLLAAEEQKQALAREFQALLDSLRGDIQRYEARTIEVIDHYTQLLDDLETEKRAFIPLYSKYHRRMIRIVKALVPMRQEVEKVRKELLQGTKKYERMYYKQFADIEHYAWIQLIGASVSQGMLATYDDLAAEWKACMQKIQKQITGASESEQQAERFIECLEQATLSLNELRTEVIEAIESISALRKCWQALDYELIKMSAGIDQNAAAIIGRVLQDAFEAMIEAWQQVREKAERSRQISFIVVVPLNELKTQARGMNRL